MNRAAVRALSPLILTAFTVCFVFSLAISSPLLDENTDWSNANPSQLHQVMAASKTRALNEREYARMLAASQAVASTQTNYDVLFHDIYIRVNDTTQVLYGRIKFVAKAMVDDVAAVEVDLNSVMVVDSIKAPSGSLVYSRLGDVVTVTLDQLYDTDQQFEFDFYYHGHPPGGGFQAFLFTTRSNGQKIISSLSEPYYARTWWPCKDRMDDKFDSANIAIEVAQELWCASNGVLDSAIQTTPNTKTFYWRLRYPMVTYLFSVSINPYSVRTDYYHYNAGADSMPLVQACYPDYVTYRDAGWVVNTPVALDKLSETWGPYPFLNEKYGHAQFQWNGAMEHQTMTSMGGGAWGFGIDVTVHEMGHQWFGDMITCESWSDIWLNEGFASYSEALFYLNRDGWAAYHTYMNSMAANAQSGTGSERTIYVYDTTSVGIIFSGALSYDKGAWVVHMLRGVLGETQFQNAIDGYVNSQYRHAAATTVEFRDVVEQATGEELDWFFEDWIFGTKYPNYQFSWMTELDGANYNTYLVVRQVQTTAPTVFRMPVDFFFDHSSGTDDTLTLLCDQRKKLFKVVSPASTIQVKCDPAGWILKATSNPGWTMYIVTLPEELATGDRWQPYRDTVQVRGGTASRTYTVLSGGLPPGVAINTQGVISGTPTLAGNYPFTLRVKDNGSSFADTASFAITINQPTLIPGDVTLDGICDGSDLQFFVDYFFSSGSAPPDPDLADVDASCVVDGSDLQYLVDYIFFDGLPPQMGCVP